LICQQRLRPLQIHANQVLDHLLCIQLATRMLVWRVGLSGRALVWPCTKE
jgi:hypothetical protein